MAKQVMTLKDAYTLLKIEKNASIDEVKQAYRKLAFALHPDLNPDNKNAVQEFQKVNDAYVTVIAYLDSQAKKQSVKAQFVDDEKIKKSAENIAKQKAKAEEERRQAEQKRKEERERKEKERQERIMRERQEMERRQAKERARAEEERRRRLQQEIERQDAKRKAKAEEERRSIMRELEEKAKEFRTLILDQMEQARKEREKRQNASSYSASGKPIYGKNGEQFESKVHATNYEKVFENDKTKNVYDEIYQTLNNSAKTSSTNNAKTERKAEKVTTSAQEKKTNERFTVSNNSVTKENGLSSTIIKASAEPLQGIKKGLSTWFKNQIDEELELFFPAVKLQPGTKMRLQFRVGLSNELQTVELTLPKDFVPGKPLRLKGMGKKIGKWQGDLYLKLQSK